jgi:phosphoribosylglycinamide formyltransferase-1
MKHFSYSKRLDKKTLLVGSAVQDIFLEYFLWSMTYVRLGMENSLTKQHACITTALDELVTLRIIQARRGNMNLEECDAIYHDFTNHDKLIEHIKAMNAEIDRTKQKNNTKRLKWPLTLKRNVYVEKVGIITYNAPHHKTAQVLERLSKKVCHSEKAIEYVVFALPYVERKARDVIFQHRPLSQDVEHTKILADKYGMEYVICKSETDIQGCEVYILCGAGILSKECVDGNKILNCHPGIIPEVRGLDAFKWAIYNNQMVGNTLYFITEEVDLAIEGLVSETPVYKDDTLKTFSDRHYDREIEMLVNYDTNQPWQRLLSHPLLEAKSALSEPNRRMSKEQEEQLSEKLKDYKFTYAKKGDMGDK